MPQKPSFSIRGLDFRLRPYGRPIFLCFGAFPSFEALADWRLTTWSDDGRSVSFGGIHPDFMTVKSSFSTFFVAVDVPRRSWESSTPRSIVTSSCWTIRGR